MENFHKEWSFEKQHSLVQMSPKQTMNINVRDPQPRTSSEGEKINAETSSV